MRLLKRNAVHEAFVGEGDGSDSDALREVHLAHTV